MEKVETAARESNGTLYQRGREWTVESVKVDGRL